eukprot:CAMPEP_0175863456 /NCGR_PEP_ID=MMETSP0107_2-20121207/32498_1 /TAXON_ID=195067 ORGANISM="Goniomonas pacifica, Strain CCMP1869" /NCGR_SAMPLE_ID=MMETSP0107_2 /ASSEMBLY_ACC=CAM_ASM_000203 /LENGTH=93 /DNA_ID=CAMNT_0017180543 /DNA_START=741 /DNA_END=1022 /DNA_ORIENTATION=+
MPAAIEVPAPQMLGFAKFLVGRIAHFQPSGPKFAHTNNLSKVLCDAPFVAGLSNHKVERSSFPLITLFRHGFQFARKGTSAKMPPRQVVELQL